MPTPSTRTLDHIVHLIPPGSIEAASEQFRALGFNVLPGGTHADGLTANALIVLPDHTYLELLAFTHPTAHHTHTAHPWAAKRPGWIDLAFLGTPGTPSIAALINARADADGSGVQYTPETRGGRRRPDGRELEWVICAPVPRERGERGDVRGRVPFFCGDVTPRAWRVPLDPPANAAHPNGARGVAHVRLLATEDVFPALSRQLATITGAPPTSSTSSEASWDLDRLETPSADLDAHVGMGSVPKLILSVASGEEESAYVRERGCGIYEVALWTSGDGGEVTAPFGRIVWCSIS
ncbi:hypothetical protein AcV7_009328 [Taiwanofungus camphoratus]|nr:hypothetical protein AcV7_009328 [Antrodia cinnamomea]